MKTLHPIEAHDLKEITDVFVLRISHKYGDNIEAYATEESALSSLHDYVSQEWDDGITEQYGALEELSMQEAIDAYFDCCDQGLDPEYYELHKLEVLPRKRVKA